MLEKEIFRELQQTHEREAGNVTTAAEALVVLPDCGCCLAVFFVRGCFWAEITGKTVMNRRE